MREICRYSGFKIVATIERGGTAMHPQLSEKDKQKCHKTIRKILEYFSVFMSPFVFLTCYIYDQGSD
jgi:hypothetical protein